MMEIVKSVRGKDILVVGGYSYTLRRWNQMSGRKNWRCLKRCVGKITTLGENILNQSPHTHPENPEEITIRKALNSLRNMAIFSNKSPSEAITEALRDIPDTEKFSLLLPCSDTLTHMVSRLRRIHPFITKLPKPNADKGLLKDKVIKTNNSKTQFGRKYWRCSKSVCRSGMGEENSCSKPHCHAVDSEEMRIANRRKRSRAVRDRMNTKRRAKRQASKLQKPSESIETLATSEFRQEFDNPDETYSTLNIDRNTMGTEENIDTGEGEKKKEIILMQGFSFVLSNECPISGQKSWRCALPGCPSEATIQGDQIISYTLHNHSKDSQEMKFLIINENEGNRTESQNIEASEVVPDNPVEDVSTTVEPNVETTPIEMEIVETYRGKEMLLAKGYSYYQRNINPSGSKNWCCSQEMCSGNITTEGANILYQTPHVHPQNPQKLKSIKAVDSIRKLARSSNKETSEVIREALRGYPDNEIFSSFLPLSETLSKMVENIRKSTSSIEDLKNTHKGELFIQHHDEELVVLTTQSNLAFLRRYPHWLCDNTSKSAPSPYHLYIISACIGQNHAVPMVYCIMRSKEQCKYEEVLNLLKGLDPELNPISVSMDFESSEIMAFRNWFPTANIHGCCYFHFVQCLWREIKILGLEAFYMSDIEQSIIFRRIQSLAFVPVDKVHLYFGFIVQKFTRLKRSFDPNIYSKIFDFLVYFRCKWIEGAGEGSLFEIKMWNVFERFQDPNCTSKALKEWHMMFRGRLGESDTVDALIKSIRVEQSRWEEKMSEWDDGALMPKMMKMCANVTHKLQDLIDKYSQHCVNSSSLKVDELLYYLNAIIKVTCKKDES